MSQQKGHRVPLAEHVSPAPTPVRIAGAVTAVSGLAALVFGVVLLVDAIGRPPTPGNNIYAEVGYYLVLGIGIMACGAGLLLGKTWARSPSIVVALILVGVGWYSTGPSKLPLLGIPFMVLGVAVIVLLFRARARDWAAGAPPEKPDGDVDEHAEKDRDAPSS